ncbi:MAG: hypothetical protein PHN75_16680, partial [Syntrophales bacterium]|nr:hypothetical protein [Syntrophales bacterium]
PGSIGEAIELTRKGFDLADRFQVPVFIMTDQYMADSLQIFEGHLPNKVLRREYGKYDSNYQRYALTENGISPMACPGMSDALVRLDSDEHDESGKITEDPDLRVHMVKKRMGKMSQIHKEAVMPTFYGSKDAKSFVLSWGGNRLIVEEAIDKLAGEGTKVSSLHFGQVYPLTNDMIGQYWLDTKQIICVENNAGGQFASLLKREFGLRVTHSLLKYNGECFNVEELYAKIKDLLS